MEEQQYLSGEAHQAMLQQQSKPHGHQRSAKIGGIFILVAVVLGLAFFGGLQYQKYLNDNLTTANGNKNGSDTGSGCFGKTQCGSGNGLSGGGNLQAPVAGQVTAVSATSITVQSSKSGESKTFSITSSTTVADNGQTIAYSDIQVGETVVVLSNNDGQATHILANPRSGNQL